MRKRLASPRGRSLFAAVAAILVSDRDILDFRYNVVAAYVDGRALDLSDRHKRLYERYRSRPKPAR